jgi:hypothetical protein
MARESSHSLDHRHPSASSSQPRVTEPRRRNTAAKRHRLKSVRHHHQLGQVYGDSDSSASAAGPSSEEYLLDIDLLREIEGEYYEQLRRQQIQEEQLLEEGNDVPDSSSMAYISESVSRVAVPRSAHHHRSRKQHASSQHRTDGGEHRRRKRKVRVAGDSLRPTGYVYGMNDGTGMRVEVADDRTERHIQSPLLSDAASDIEAIEIDGHTHRTKPSRHKTTRDARVRRIIHVSAEADVGGRRDTASITIRERNTPRRHSNHSFVPQLHR